jgi:hypothetical protein
VSGKLAGFRRRLAQIEKALGETAEQEELADCICKLQDGVSSPTIAFSNKPEDFEAEMNQKCPVHGFRSLGRVMVFRIVGPGQKKDERCRLDDLLDEYRAREAEYLGIKKVEDAN